MRTRVGSMRSKDGMTKNLLTPSFQADVVGQNRSCNTITLAPSAPTNSLTGASNIYQFLLMPGSVTERSNGMRLTMQVANTSSVSSVTMTPPALGLQRLEIYNGNNELINTLYAETLLADYNLYLNEWEFNMASSAFGLTTSWNPNIPILTLAPNGVQNFSIYLYSVWDVMKPYMKKISENILFKFYFRNAISSGSGSLSLTNMNLCFDVDITASYNDKYIHELYDSNILRYSYLDKINISQSLVFNPSQATKYTLQNLIGKVAFFIFMIRANVSSTNQGYNNYIPIGQTSSATLANVQVQAPSSYDVLNYGQGLSLVDLNLINASYMDNNLFSAQPIYLVPFTSSVKQSLMGIQESGFFYFDGSNYILQIIPDATFNGGVGGTFQLDVFAYYFRTACVDSGSIKVYNN